MELPRVTEPISAPSTLQGLVEEYNSRAKLGDNDICALLLKDALGYFARYYAAVCVAACRELDCLPGEIAQTWSGTPAVEVALPALEWCLERLRSRNERLARKLVAVFFDRDGGHRPFARYCLPSLENGDLNLPAFCSGTDERRDDEHLAEAARLLDAWISASFGFFLESEQRLETGAYFGQLEQVVRFEQYTLRTGLTMRVRESRGTGVPAAALAAPAVSLSVPLAAPAEAAEADPAAAEPAVPVDEAQPPTPLPAPQAVVAPEAQALHSFLKNQQQPRPSSVPPPAVESGDEPKIQVRLEPLGFMRSRSGKIGYGGHLWIESTSGDEVRGLVESTGGDVELTGAFFEGVSNRVVYWVHTDDVATGKEYLKISCDGDERLYALWKLAPPSRFENLTRAQQTGLLLAPGLLGVLYSLWVWYSTHRDVYAQLVKVLGANFDRFINSTAPLSLRQAGVGELDVNIMPRIESTVLIFLLVGWLVPVAVAKLYSRFPRRDQKALVLVFWFGCSLPLLAYACLWGTGLTQSAITQHPELALIDFRRNMIPFAVLNALAGVYEIISVSGVLHRHLNELGRFALAFLLAVMAAMGIVAQVYGNSWFG